MGALRAVEEVEVEDDGLAVTGQPGGQPAQDVGEVERLVALGVDGATDLGPRQRWHERLGHDARHLDLGRLDDVGGEDAVGDQEHVGVEAGTLVAGPHLADDAVDGDLLAGRQDAIGGHDVVELQVPVGRQGDPELERGGVVGAQHSPNDVHRANLLPSRRD